MKPEEIKYYRCVYLKNIDQLGFIGIYATNYWDLLNKLDRTIEAGSKLLNYQEMKTWD